MGGFQGNVAHGYIRLRAQWTGIGDRFLAWGKCPLPSYLWGKPPEMISGPPHGRVSLRSA